MAISKKNKSRVSVDCKEYLWWVFDEYDQTEFDGIQIKAVCSDQTHFIKYGLQQKDANCKLVFALKDYTKLVHLSSPPRFENNKGIKTFSINSNMMTQEHLCQWINNGNGEDFYFPAVNN